ncbi:MAG: response regulator transcription factor [Chloroflexi bacterium]|nr:response regulator transcription factor [Chloroflexota bacterium]
MANQKIRILVVDDHPLMREALCMAIEDEADMQVVGEAANGEDAVRQAHALKPDVTVMDLFMPRQDGLHAIADIKSRDANARILALTSSTDEAMVLAAVQAGVLGYLMKDSAREELLQAIRQVSQGNTFLPPQIAQKLANSVREQKKEHATPPVEPLTDREIEVLGLIGQGASNKQIAQTLNVSEGTVRTHVHNLLGKLGLENRNQAILYAVRAGITKM